MVEITVASGLGPSNRNVSFQTSAPPSDIENQVFEKIKEILGTDIPEEFLRETIRKHPDLDLSDVCISGLVDEILKSNDTSPPPPPIYGPEKQSTATDTCMEMVPYVGGSGAEKETSDLQKAIQDSMSLNDAERVNLEELVRNPNISTGLKNSGNTCWFNCLAQMLYSLSSFRSVIYHCVPISWTGEQIVNIRRDDVLYAELLLGFRKLFADLHFTEMSYIEVGDLLKTVEALHRKNRSDSMPTIGNQQDATEMLILIFEWLETALNAAVHAHLNPDLRIDNIDDNIVVAESTTAAPNSEMAGTAPPDYSFGEISSGVKREAQSRPNSPLAARKSPEFAVPLAPSGSRVIVMRNDLSAIDEAMDTSEGTSRHARSPPFPAKMPRRAPVVAPEPSEGLKELVDQLKQKFEQLFTAKLTSSTISDDNSVSNETHTQNCPQIFQLQLSYGNLHDALEASTYDTGRNAISHVQNLYEELPAVIFMGLSRFVFENSASIKLHDRFTFPRVVYMDRYLKSNADFVEGLRSRQNEQREELARLRAQRNGLCRYPHGNGGETKLADVFETAIQALMNVNGSEEPSENIAFTGPLTPLAYNANNQKSTSFVKNLGKIYPNFPQTREIEATIKTLQSLKLDVMSEENNCSARELELEELIEHTYEVPELQKHQYELRAMIVHSGEANIGHYFTYRLKKSIDGTEIWEKLNDQKTDQVTWPQVESDAFGSGSGSPSAYLLMYVRTDATWLDAADTLTAQEALAQLPSDLSEYVEQQQKSWKSRLQNYRELQASGGRKEDSAFTWCRKTLKKQNVRGDENANPELTQTDLLRIPVYKHMCVFNEAEINEVVKLSSMLWNNILKIEPHRFASPEELLTHHLRMAMIHQYGGMQFMEKFVSYPIRELREDAENDVERIYDNFVTKYLDTTLQCEPASSNSNLLLFVSSRVDNINFAVIRFLLVLALTHCEVEPIAQRARQELSKYCEMDVSSMRKMRLVALMLAQAYEMGTIAVYGARKALETFKEAEDRGELTVEKLFTAMTAARLSRVCSRYVRDLSFLKPSHMFVAPEVLRIVTIIPLLKMAKTAYQHVVDERLQMKEMEFLMSHNERRISIDAITNEMEAAIHCVHIWFRELEISEEPMSIPGSSYPVEINIDTLYRAMISCVEVLVSYAVVLKTPPKQAFLTKIATALQILPSFNEQLPSDLGRFEPDTLDVEEQKIFKILLDLGNGNDKVDRVNTEIQKVISGSYE